MRLEKKSIVDEITAAVGDADYALMVDYVGMSVQAFAGLRSELRENDSSVMVAKNSFMARATKDLGLPNLDDILSGPTAVVTGCGDITQVAKILAKQAKAIETFSVKGGVMGGSRLTAADVGELASIPPREVMLARMVGTVAAPMSALVGVMQQKLSTLVYVLKAVEDKKNNA
jgi:large subunit ribosomal protein L10